MKIKLWLYQVIYWGGDGENDIVFLVSASSVGEAADLADQYASSKPKPTQTQFAQAVYEIAPDPRLGDPTVIIGPCSQLAYGYGWKAWKREEEGGEWKLDHPNK